MAPVRLALVGAERMTKVHMENALKMEGVGVEGVYDIDRGRAEEEAFLARRRHAIQLTNS